MKAIIPSAGLGTRFMPVTKSVPKELLPVINKPVIQYVVEEANAAPASEGAVIVNSPEKPLIEDYFQRRILLEDTLRKRDKHDLADLIEYVGQLPISTVYQHAPLGLGHAVYCASQETGNEPFYVLLADVIVPDHSILPMLYEVSQKHGGASVVAVIEVSEEETSRFGIISGSYIEHIENEQAVLSGALSKTSRGSVYKLDSMVEKPAPGEAPSRLALFGRYLLSPNIMGILRDTKAGRGGEIQLTDAMLTLLETEDIYALVIGKDDGYDTGTVANLIAANIKMAQRDEKLSESIKNMLKNE
ncbi:MAG: sugar phosphate nucleotidyltransferase [Coriobacteriia bacterium]|nr:sugar phosphate nucleotidyltransferase [Coriobacteriia bacterium]